MIDKNTILIVDDDDAHRTMLCTLIGGWGYAVSEADDGSAAIQMVQEQSFDLVLMDVRMVKVSGLEALDKIKSYNPGNHHDGIFVRRNSGGGIEARGS